MCLVEYLVYNLSLYVFKSRKKNKQNNNNNNNKRVGRKFLFFFFNEAISEKSQLCLCLFIFQCIAFYEIST